MRTFTLVAAFAGLVSATPAPAPQVLNFALIQAAPTVATGPTGLAVQQNASVVTSVSVPTGTVQKRDLAAILSAFNCYFYHVCGTTTTTTSTSSSTTTTTTKATTTSPSTTTTTPSSTTTTPKSTSTTTSTTTSTSASGAIAGPPGGIGATPIVQNASPSSSSTSAVPTMNTISTSTTSSSGACPTTPEAGTYCGFINPEDPCAPQPDGYGPANLSVSQFMSYPAFSSAAYNAPVQVASQQNGQIYQQVFVDLNASASANSYLGLYTLQSYDVSGCAAHCDSTALCTSFNIFIERDPSQCPSANDSTAPTVWGYWCPNPPAITNYKCTLWGSSLSASVCTNTGSTEKQFIVVITGSNGYDMTNGTIPTVSVANGYAPTTTSAATTIPSTTSTSSTSTSTSTSTTTSSSTTTTSTTTSTSTTTKSSTSSSTTSSASTLSTTTPSISVSTTSTSSASTSTPSVSWGSGHNCGGKAVNAPGRSIGQKVITGPYNPQLCADYAQAQNAANKAAAQAAGSSSWTPCNYINAAYYHKNGIPYGTVCNLYTQVIDSSYETYTGGNMGSDYYGCQQSWTWQLKYPSNYNQC